MDESRVSEIERVMMCVIDVLIEDGGFFTAAWGQVLKTMASRVFDKDVKTGDTEYHKISIAVLKLEEIEFVGVSRANKREAEKANIIESIRLL